MVVGTREIQKRKGCLKARMVRVRFREMNIIQCIPLTQHSSLCTGTVGLCLALN